MFFGSSRQPDGVSRCVCVFPGVSFHTGFQTPWPSENVYQNLFKTSLFSSVAPILFSFSNPHTDTLSFCFIICTKSRNIKIATATVWQQSSETLITPGCSQQEIKCAVLDALAAIHGFNDISGFSRLWHEHQGWVVSRFLMACSRMRSGSCGTRGHTSVGGRRCQVQVPSLPCWLADNRKQEKGTGSHPPVERQDLLEWFYWQKYLQGNILWKKLIHGHDLCKTVSSLSTTYFSVDTVIFSPNCLCKISLSVCPDNRTKSSVWKYSCHCP